MVVYNIVVYVHVISKITTKINEFLKLFLSLKLVLRLNVTENFFFNCALYLMRTAEIPICKSDFGWIEANFALRYLDLNILNKSSHGTYAPKKEKKIGTQ